MEEGTTEEGITDGKISVDILRAGELTGYHAIAKQSMVNRRE